MYLFDDKVLFVLVAPDRDLSLLAIYTSLAMNSLPNTPSLSDNMTETAQL